MKRNEDYRFVLRESVDRIRADADSVSGNEPYDQGRRMAYYEMLQAILANAEAVGLSAADVGLEGFDAGRLVGTRSSRAA